jgi:hypothetical protein
MSSPEPPLEDDRAPPSAAAEDAHAPDLPDRVTAALRQIYATWRAVRASGRDVDLVADPFRTADARPAAVRGTAATIHRLHGTGPQLDLVVDVLPGRQAGVVDVVGQLLFVTPPRSPIQVELWQADTLRRVVDVTATGEFECRALATGTYTLVVGGSATGVLLPGARLELTG